MNKAAWEKRLKELHTAVRGSARQFELGDHVALGIATFGRTAAFDAAAKITGAKHTRNFFTRCVAVASYYPAELRFPALQFHTYEVLRRFPIEFLTRFIPVVEPLGLSCAQTYELAVAQYGSDPRLKRKSMKVHSVRLPERLYQALAARAKPASQAHVFIAKVLEDYLAAPQSAEKIAPGARPSDVPAPADTQPRPETSTGESTPRPDYAERRAAQKATDSCITADGKFCEKDKTVFGKQSKSAGQRKYTCKHKLLFTACKSDAWVDGDVPTQFSKRKTAATRFKTRELADIAAREYQKDRGYAIESMRCEVCKCWHIVGKNFGPFKAAEIDLTKEQSEVRVTVQDALQQHAQA